MKRPGPGLLRRRPTAPSLLVRATPREFGGGRPREALVREARRAIRRGSASFAVASLLFDRVTRERVWLLYAWCRRCDDIADGQEDGGSPVSVDGAAARFRAIRVLTARAMRGQPTAEPAFDCFGQVAHEAGLRAAITRDVIQGFALDAADWQPRSESDLMRYCYHVAGAVGVMMARVMGVPAEDVETLDRACDLGLAFQLNNIARDIAQDAAAGRCYLPGEWLAAADIPPGELMKPPYREALAGLAARLVALAETHEAAARIGAARLPFRKRWAVLAAANIYGAIGREVRARGTAAWNRRVHTSTFTKMWLVLRGFRDALTVPPVPARWPRWTRPEILAAMGRTRRRVPARASPVPSRRERSAG